MKQATSIATHMVREWGMSEKMGLRTVSDNGKTYSDVLGPATNELVILLHSVHQNSCINDAFVGGR